MTRIILALVASIICGGAQGATVPPQADTVRVNLSTGTYLMDIELLVVGVAIDQGLIPLLDVPRANPDWSIFFGAVENDLGLSGATQFDMFVFTATTDEPGFAPYLAESWYWADPCSDDICGWEGLSAGFDFRGDDLAELVTLRLVPVPAAAWLFGSALGLLGWIRSRTAKH